MPVPVPWKYLTYSYKAPDRFIRFCLWSKNQLKLFPVIADAGACFAECGGNGADQRICLLCNLVILSYIPAKINANGTSLVYNKRNLKRFRRYNSILCFSNISYNSSIYSISLVLLQIFFYICKHLSFSTIYCNNHVSDLKPAMNILRCVRYVSNN